MKRLLAIVIGAAILSGCTTIPINRPTASGKAEGIYPDRNKEQVKDALVSFCNGKGLNVFEATESTVICGKPADSVIAQMVVGNAYSTAAMAKTRFTIATVSNASKVWADMWLESQMPGGQVNQMPITSNGAINRAQAVLDNLNP